MSLRPLLISFLASAAPVAASALATRAFGIPVLLWWAGQFGILSSTVELEPGVPFAVLFRFAAGVRVLLFAVPERNEIQTGRVPGD